MTGVTRRTMLRYGALALSSILLPDRLVMAQSSAPTYPWGVPMPTVSNTQSQYFLFVNTPNGTGTFAAPNSMQAASSLPAGSYYNSAQKAPSFTWRRPLAYAPGNWDSTEFPTSDLQPLQSSIYSAASQYTQRYFQVSLAQATDQQKVAAIIAALRDKLLGNFVSLNLEPTGTPQDAVIATEVSNWIMGSYKMMAIIANAINDTNRAGFKIQCTETAPILTFMLNGYGICAREWDIVFRDDLTSANASNPPDPAGQSAPGVFPTHGTVEYYDRQFGKWVLVDLLYGVTGVINNRIANSPTNIGGVQGVPLSLPEFAFALANNIAFPVLWTRRNELNLSDADRWYTVLSAQQTYLARDSQGTPYDPNGNPQMQATFMNFASPYTQYVTQSA